LGNIEPIEEEGLHASISNLKEEMSVSSRSNDDDLLLQDKKQDEENLSDLSKNDDQEENQHADLFDFKINSEQSSQIEQKQNTTFTKLSKVEKGLTQLKYTSKMMRNLMFDLLDLAQLENGSLTINNEYFNLFDVLENAFGVLKHFADEKCVSLVGPSRDGADSSYFIKLYGDERRY
jgi:signal transduction histidine kinase